MPAKGCKQSDEAKRKISEANKGNKYGLGLRRSEEFKLKMSEIQKGKKHFLGKHHSEESKEKLRQANLGKHHSEETKLKIGGYHKGFVFTEETLIKLRLATAGENNPNWQGGITPINFAIRNSNRYKNWRIFIFERDNYTCQKCNKKGGYLHSHHIKPFSKYPELRFEVDNGITYCKDCHKIINREQLLGNNYAIKKALVV